MQKFHQPQTLHHEKNHPPHADAYVPTTTESDESKNPSKPPPNAPTEPSACLRRTPQPSMTSPQQTETKGEGPSSTPPTLQGLSNEDMADSNTKIAPHPDTPQTNIKTHLLSDDYYAPAAVIHLERNKVQVDLGTVFTHLIRKTGLSDPKMSTDEDEGTDQVRSCLACSVEGSTLCSRCPEHDILD